MAFNANGLAALAYANGFTQWHYKSTSDNLATIMAAGYFTGSALTMLRVGDEMRIQASDGYWVDVVWSNDGTTVQIGVDVLSVQDSTDGASFALGTVRKRYDGSEWMYLEGIEAVDPMDVMIVHLDGTAAQLTATNAAASLGSGKQIAVVAEGTPSQAIADGDYFWGCIFAPGTAGVKFNAVASVEAGQELYASGTDGHLTDVFDGDVAVRGIVSLEEDDVEPVGAITYPYVVNTIDS